MGPFPTPYPRWEPKPDVLLLYTNSGALKKITASTLSVFYVCQQN